MENEHQLTLNRLSFELEERQRYVPDLSCDSYTPYLNYHQTRAKEKGVGTKERGVDQTRQKQGSYYGQR